MIPIGEQLRVTRERKSLSLDRVADETNIAKRYLVALEEEDFSVFPGDPYVIGFLRNYADYLGLSSDDLVNAYKNIKIQEQPVPLEELIPKQGPSKLLIGSIAGAAVVVLAIVIALVAHHHSASQEVISSHRQATEYRVEGQTFEKRVFVGDSLLVNYNNDKYKILLSHIDEAVTIETPVGAIRLMLGEEKTVDLEKNNQPGIKVSITDMAKKDASKGAVLKLEYTSAQAAEAAAAQAPAAADQGQGDSTAAAAASDPIASAADSATQVPASATPSGKPFTLFEAGKKTPYPFVISVTFRGPCMFRYEIDKRDRLERYYRKGETVTVNAQNSVKLWTSNAQSVKLTVQASGGKSADLDMGGAGEISVKRIAWIQDGGAWVLSASEVD